MKSKVDRSPLRGWLQSKNILGILFDLDDTIIKTNEIFTLAVQEVITLYVKALPKLSTEEVSGIFSAINIAIHKKHSVNPNRWNYVIKEFEKKMKIRKSKSKQALEILAGIYKKHPEFEVDADVLLQLLKNWGILLGLVTHANAAWTIFKLQSLGLDAFFDHIEVVSENQLHKTADDWHAGAQGIRVPEKKLLGVGDNVEGDVRAAVAAGFGEVIWVDKKDGWGHYRQGTLPSGVHVVTGVGQLLQLKK